MRIREVNLAFVIHCILFLKSLGRSTYATFILYIYKIMVTRDAFWRRWSHFPFFWFIPTFLGNNFLTHHLVLHAPSRSIVKNMVNDVHLYDSTICRLCAADNGNEHLFISEVGESDLCSLVNRYLPLKVRRCFFKTPVKRIATWFPTSNSRSSSKQLLHWSNVYRALCIVLFIVR